MKENPKWLDNSIQFPRLLAEMEAMGVFNKTIKYNNGYYSVSEALCQEMDLEMGELMELVSRAQTEWDKIKENMRQD